MRNILDLHDMESEKNFPEITSSYDLEKDAYNWRCAMNAFTNGRSYEKMSEEDLNILSQIKWSSQERANKILLPYLDKKYKNNREYIEEAVGDIKDILDKQKSLIFEHMERLTKHPILRDDFHIYFTTCSRGPYNWRTWEIWTFDPPEKTWRLRAWSWGFAHELLHMQTHKYYENEYPMNQLNWKQFNLIKESLTFLLNHEFQWVNLSTDRWYPNHQEFRKIFENYRLSCWDKKDFDDLINFGCKYILDNNILSD